MNSQFNARLNKWDICCSMSVTFEYMYICHVLLALTEWFGLF